MKIFKETIYNVEFNFSEIYTIKEALQKYLGHISVQELIDQIDESLKD